MDEVAAASIVAQAVLEICHTFLGFVLAVGGVILAQLMVSVGKLALSFVRAVAEFCKLFAEFQLLLIAAGVPGVLVAGRVRAIGRNRGG